MTELEAKLEELLENQDRNQEPYFYVFKIEGDKATTSFNYFCDAEAMMEACRKYLARMAREQNEDGEKMRNLLGN